MRLIPLAKLRSSARDALAYVSAQPGVAEAEVFASANGNLTVRLNYTSHIPTNGVEEPKSVESQGLGIRPGNLGTGIGCIGLPNGRVQRGCRGVLPMTGATCARCHFASQAGFVPNPRQLETPNGL